jgi:hypothetical protein
MKLAEPKASAGKNCLTSPSLQKTMRAESCLSLISNLD